MLSSVSCTTGFVAVPLPSTNIRVAPASPPAFSAGIRRLRAVTSCRRTRHENLTSGPLQLTSDNSDDFGDFRSRDNDDDDDDISKAFINLAYIDGALDDRIESISWLPSLSDRSSPSSEEGTSEEEPISITRIRKDSRIMPLFPMGSEIFTPHSDHSLSIFEPRYVEMYDYLMDSDLSDGKPEFVVAMNHPYKPDSFAEYGVIFRVVDFVEMDESEVADIYDEEERPGGELGEEADVKYVAHHEVVGIVKIHRILNPKDWQTAETYMRVEATVVDDLSESTFAQSGEDNVGKKARKWESDDPLSVTAEQRQNPFEGVLELRDLFSQLVDVQHELNEDVRFARASIGTFARGVSEGPRGFWLTVLSWQQYAEQRILSRHVELQGAFQEKLMDYLGRDREAPDSIDVADLPPYLRDEATEVERRVKMELGPLRLELSLAMQHLLETETQGERVKILSDIIGLELQRIRTKKAISSIFGDKGEGASVAALGISPKEIKVDEEAASVEEARLRLEKLLGAGSSGGTGADSREMSDASELYSRGIKSYDDLDAFQ